MPLKRAVQRAIVIMGVSGCGKTTLGRALANRLRWQFIEGDSLHPPANIAKMAAGIPLDDADRLPFLEAVAQKLVEGRNSGVVASCSALRRRYRDLLRERAGEILFVLPEMDRPTLVSRLNNRADHFMPSSLVDSQLAALEVPGADEATIPVDGTLPTDLQVAAVLSKLGAFSPTCPRPPPERTL